ncbi:unnamed protein product [Ranitomeya imitator]|uniref:Uncharacterized protein n=1 Tax=Ranitomeya imitator TaxID=111125 RepID=A0ABN9M8Q7_9NEOB|nr:unnamed protein product [Ranitomeya imitator]
MKLDWAVCTQEFFEQSFQGVPGVIILYPECQCHYPVPPVSVSLSCTPSVSIIILYPQCQCHYPVSWVSVSLSCTPSISVLFLYPEYQCHYPVPRVSVSLSCTPSVSIIILYPECQCHLEVETGICLHRKWRLVCVSTGSGDWYLSLQEVETGICLYRKWRLATKTSDMNSYTSFLLEQVKIRRKEVTCCGMTLKTSVSISNSEAGNKCGGRAQNADSIALPSSPVGLHCQGTQTSTMLSQQTELIRSLHQPKLRPPPHLHGECVSRGDKEFRSYKDAETLRNQIKGVAPQQQ